MKGLLGLHCWSGQVQESSGQEMQIQIVVITVIVYNKFQELPKMSLFHLFQNSGNINDLVARNLMALRLREQQNIIKVISVALTKSLNSFESSLLSLSVPSIQGYTIEPPSIPCHNEAKTAVIEILSDSEEAPVRKQQKFKQKNECKTCPSLTPIIQLQSDAKHIEQNPTSSENHLEEPQRKTKTKLIKKQKQEKQVGKSSVKIPKIDYTETCSLPNLNMERKTLKARRQALLRRQVSTWGLDPKKQKREIRMLSH